MKTLIAAFTVCLCACATTGSSSSSSGGGSGGNVSAVGGHPAIRTACDLKAVDFATQQSAKEGQPILVDCPQACADGIVWGSGLYTDDSLVCRALVHAGAIPAAGGVGAITFAPGQLTYLGSDHNGVATNAYGKWARSFYAQAIDANGNPQGAPPTIYDDHTGLVVCGANPFGGSVGEVFTAICVEDCTGGNVWGSNPYTGDSALCTAAHHAGLINGPQQKLRVTIGGPLEAFKGSTANGFTTQDYGAFGSSYTLSPAQ